MQEIHNLSTKTLYRKYTNPGEFYEAVKNPFNPETSHIVNSTDKFYGMSWTDALSAFKSGFRVKSDKMLIDSNKLLANIPVEIPEIRADIIGDYFDIGQAINGIPECFYRTEKLPQDPVNIAINICFSSYIKAYQVYNRGIAIVALIKTLRNAEIPVKVTFCNRTRSNSYFPNNVNRYFWDMDFPVEPFDLDLFNFITCSESFLRRLELSNIEKICQNSNPVGYGYPAKIKDFPEYIPSDNPIIFDEIEYSEYQSIEESEQTIKSIIDQINKVR